MSTPNPLAELVAKELADRKESGWSKEPLPSKPPPPPIAHEPLPTPKQVLEQEERQRLEKKRGQLREIIVNRYLLTGKDHSAAELVKITLFPLVEIKAMLKGGLPGIEAVKRGKVSFYGPSREHLRTLVIKAELSLRALNHLRR